MNYFSPCCNTRSKSPVLALYVVDNDDMFFIYIYLLREVPDFIDRAEGLFVVIHSFINVVKFFVEIIALVIGVDCLFGGIVGDAELANALVECFTLGISLVGPLAIVVLSGMILTGVLVPINDADANDDAGDEDY